MKFEINEKMKKSSKTATDFNFKHDMKKEKIRQLKESGQNWNRTSDTRIFSPLLYRLSYLAKLRSILAKESTIVEDTIFVQ
jgi:hypothetical protein